MTGVVAFLLPSLAGGGVGRAVLRLAAAFRDAGHPVDLVTCKAEGPYLDAIPSGVRLVTLEHESWLASRMRLLCLDPGAATALARPALLAWRPAPVQPYLASLCQYLERRRPAVLLAAKTPTNLLALWAQRRSGDGIRVIVVEHSQLSQSIESTRRWRWRYIAPLVARAYAHADAIVCVSDGVADDLARVARLPRSRFMRIYNPVVMPELGEGAAEPPPHPWLEPCAGPPVVLAAGRLVPQKNFPLLLRAFAKLRAQRPARLLILGEGKQRTRLEALVQELGLEADVALPGYVANPYAAYARAALFVLSSDWEGLPTVLIEAMACGCPVVSTDCPSGPAEILDDGRYGKLVATGDAAALGAAMAETLDAPPAAETLRERAARFSLESSAREYRELVAALLSGAARATSGAGVSPH